MDQGPRIALIGASGQLAADLLRTLQWPVTRLARPAVDVRDAAALRDALAGARPTHVINCAAMTHVDGCEDDAEMAFAVNAVGAGNVARAAHEVGARLLHVSTDFVFGADAERDRPYDEQECPGPVSVYGVSKLAGEQLVAAADPHAIIVRTCGLYGHAGARGKGGNFVETMLRCAGEGRALRVVADQTISPTSALGCARVIAALLERDAPGGVYHVAARDACTWHAFAQAIVDLAGCGVLVTPIESHEYPVKARRPKYAALTSSRLASLGVPGCPTWREMLAEYIAARTKARVATAV